MTNKPLPGDDDWIDPRTEAEIDESYRRSYAEPIEPVNEQWWNSGFGTSVTILGLFGLIVICIYVMLHWE